MANEQNLKPFTSEQNREEAKKNGHKGGIASGKARREKADFIRVAKSLMNCEISEANKKQIEAQFKELTTEEISYRALILIKQLEKAVKGDINSAKFLIEATGEKPKEEIDTEVKLPIFNIEVTNNEELKKEFEGYEANTETE